MKSFFQEILIHLKNIGSHYASLLSLELGMCARLPLHRDPPPQLSSVLGLKANTTSLFCYLPFRDRVLLGLGQPHACFVAKADAKLTFLLPLPKCSYQTKDTIISSVLQTFSPAHPMASCYLTQNDIYISAHVVSNMSACSDI